MDKDKKIFLIIKLILITILFILIILYFNYPRVKYKYDSDNECYYVSKVYGNSSKYEIKESINGISVKYIDERAFQYKDKVKEVVLPSSIETIKKLAFSDCTSLECINLENVKEIERNAFSYCYNLDNIETSASLGGSCFYKCSNLSNITLDEGVKSIGTYALSYTAIKNLKLPNSVLFVYMDAFIYMDNLTEISASSSLKENTYLQSLNNINFIWR